MMRKKPITSQGRFIGAYTGRSAATFVSNLKPGESAHHTPPSLFHSILRVSEREARKFSSFFVSARSPRGAFVSLFQASSRGRVTAQVPARVLCLKNGRVCDCARRSCACARARRTACALLFIKLFAFDVRFLWFPSCLTGAQSSHMPHLAIKI